MAPYNGSANIFRSTGAGVDIAALFDDFPLKIKGARVLRDRDIVVLEEFRVRTTMRNNSPTDVLLGACIPGKLYITSDFLDSLEGSRKFTAVGMHLDMDDDVLFFKHSADNPCQMEDVLAADLPLVSKWARRFSYNPMMEFGA